MQGGDPGGFRSFAQSQGCFELWGRRDLGKILPLRRILGAVSPCVLLCVNAGGCSGGSGRFW